MISKARDAAGNESAWTVTGATRTDTDVVSAVIRWTGAARDNNWYTPANWDIGRVPAGIDYVTISSGGITVAVNASSPAIGFASLTLTPPSGLFTLKVSTAVSAPAGWVTVGNNATLRLDNASLIVSAFTYFNRGVEIRGAGRIGNLNRGVESPVDGFAVASTRVLKGIRLPGVRSLDRLLATFETGTASVKIGGTLGVTEVRVVPLPEVIDPFRRLLWAELRE
jgi:hypothetical protein